MTNEKSAFSNLRTLATPVNVKIANRIDYPATGIGRVHIRLTDDTLLTLFDCLYIPDFEVSLLSVDALNDANLDVCYGARNCTCQIRHFNATKSDYWTFIGKRN